MESLANYDSDDDTNQYSNMRDDPVVPAQAAYHAIAESRRRKQFSAMNSDGTNYEQIQMELSEDSNSSREDATGSDLLHQNNILQQTKSSSQPLSSQQQVTKLGMQQKESKETNHSFHKDDDKNKSRDRDNRGERDRNRERDRESDRREKSDRERDKYRKGRDDRDDTLDYRRDRNHDRDYRKDRDIRGGRAYNRDRDYNRDREKRDRGYSNRDYNRERESNRNDRDTNRDHRDSRHKDRDDRGGQSSNDRKLPSNSHDQKELKGSRSRSKSRERLSHSSTNSNTNSSSSIPLSRIERSNIKVQQLKKMGIEIQGKPINEPIPAEQSNSTVPFVINPRYAEQIQKRKLLWQTPPSDAEKSKGTTNKWENTKFSQDSDGKMASKFLRLMGMKDAPKSASTVAAAAAPAATTTTATNDPADTNKQAEMFSTMEQQYEVARQVTHTMRGMGLGFGSHQRQY